MSEIVQVAPVGNAGSAQDLQFAQVLNDVRTISQPGLPGANTGSDAVTGTDPVAQFVNRIVSDGVNAQDFMTRVKQLNPGASATDLGTAAGFKSSDSNELARVIVEAASAGVILSMAATIRDQINSLVEKLLRS